MSDEKQDLRSMADRLRGKAAGDAREFGNELSAQKVSKAQTVTEISGPAATPKLSQDQAGSVRQRHVTEKQPNQVGRPAGGQAEKMPAQEQTVSAVKDKSLAEAAKGLREASVTGGRAANEVSPPKPTPAVAKKPERGRGR